MRGELVLVHGVPNIRDELIECIVVQIWICVIASFVDRFSNQIETMFGLVVAVHQKTNQRDKQHDYNGHDGPFSW